MSTGDVRQRRIPEVGRNSQDQSDIPVDATANISHPAGDVRHGGSVQLLRVLSFVTYFAWSIVNIHATQILGLPLYLISKDYFYAYMSWTKQSFGLFITILCRWWSPTTLRVSGDRSVQDQLRKSKDGRLECTFPERLVLIANHQLYSDWLYLWWIAYTNRMHGHIFIILKESLKYIPLLGPGMMLYGFIFLARNWLKDKPRFAHRLQKLKARHTGPLSGSSQLDPMWLLIFPEGTNLSNNGRNTSARWAEKQGLADFQHELHPRSTGLLYCLQELRGTVDWVYDCTVAYEGIPRGKYGQDFFTLRAFFIEGRPPKSVNMYWRRFAVSSIPLENADEFARWLRLRWAEKDDLLELYMRTGRFPPSEDDDAKATGSGYIETGAHVARWWEFGQIFYVLLLAAAALYIFGTAWDGLLGLLHL